MDGPRGDQAYDHLYIGTHALPDGELKGIPRHNVELLSNGKIPRLKEKTCYTVPWLGKMELDCALWLSLDHLEIHQDALAADWR